MGALDCVQIPNSKMTGSTEVFAVSMSSNSTLNEPRQDLESQTLTEGYKRHSIWWKILVDIPLLLTVGLLIGLFELGVFPSHKSGFFCNDPAISYPYNGDTVTTGILMSVILISPLVTFFITELALSDHEISQKEKKIIAGRETLRLCRSYVYGFVFNLGIVEVMKGITGSPRPTFFDICQPDTASLCNGTTYQFVASFECTSTKFSSWMQKDAYHSFPSGHTSLSVYCGVFMAWYLQRRAFDWRNRTVLLVPALQLLFITFAAISSLTRVTDRRHHWWDVVVGFLVGIISFLYAAVVLCNNFTRNNNKENTIQPLTKNLGFDSSNEPVSP